MKIKQSKQLIPGDIVKWEIIPENAVPVLGRRVGKTVDIQVQEVYTHHVLFRIMEPPYLKLDIQNVQLFQKGVYKNDDLLNPFVRVEDE